MREIDVTRQSAVRGPSQRSRAMASIAAACYVVGCSAAGDRGAETSTERAVPTCDPTEVVEVSSAERTSALVDLDCDGVVDTVELRLMTDGTIRRPSVVVRGSVEGELSTDWDQLPQLISFGDLNGDSIRDILVVDVTESSVFANVVLVRQLGGLELAQFESDSLRRETQYRFHDVTWPSECVNHLMPRIQRESQQALTVSIATGDWRREGDCARAVRRKLEVRDSHFVIVK